MVDADASSLAAHDENEMMARHRRRDLALATPQGGGGKPWGSKDGKSKGEEGKKGGYGKGWRATEWWTSEPATSTGTAPATGEQVQNPFQAEADSGAGADRGKSKGKGKKYGGKKPWWS